MKQPASISEFCRDKVTGRRTLDVPWNEMEWPWLETGNLVWNFAL